MTRLFVGTFIPPADQSRFEEVKAQNAHLDETWLCRVRWVRPEKLHLTWIFIGEVADEAIAVMKSAVQDAVSEWRAGNPETIPRVQYEKRECWPGERRAKVMVLTPASVEESVFTLADSLQKKLLPLCPPGADRYGTYRPHLTIARFGFDSRSKPKSARIKLDQLKLPEGLLPLTHLITNVSLIESRMGRGEDYLTLSKIDLT